MRIIWDDCRSRVITTVALSQSIPLSGGQEGMEFRPSNRIIDASCIHVLSTEHETGLVIPQARIQKNVFPIKLPVTLSRVQTPRPLPKHDSIYTHGRNNRVHGLDQRSIG
jgi:hypothetical protein